MDIDKFLQSKAFKGFIIGISCFIVLVLVFKVGMFVGAMKADFSFRWAEQYHRNFAGPKGGFFNDFKDDFIARDFIASNGVFGQIIKIDGQQLIIKGPKDLEKVIIVNDKTIIKYQKDDLKISDLKIDDLVVVVGEPNSNGQIEAKLIRVMPLINIKQKR